MPTTADAPKCYAEVQGKRMLDWCLQALARSGINDICFIGGYQIDKVSADYPRFTFRHNVDWKNNNILASLMFAEDLMDEPFVCTYSDVLFTSDVVKKLLDNSADIVLAVDTSWLDRYEHRRNHPPSDAEKVISNKGLVTRIHRDIEPSAANGEFTGIAKFSSRGAATLRTHYHRCRKLYAGKPFREAVAFEKAYFILLLQEMIEAGVEIAHADTAGEYIEVDTQEDFDLAQSFWRG
jgi:L-glutamine-phosphate cytidylyltransferase